MSLKRLLWFLVIAFGVFFLVHSPREAAKLVEQAGSSAQDIFATAAHSLTRFIKSLT